MKKNREKQDLLPLTIVLLICCILLIQVTCLVIKLFCGLL